MMNDSRRHQEECGAGGSMYVHSEQRRNLESKPFHESTVFTLLPPRPRSYEVSSRGSELLGLQVQGFCCPLQQRPSSGRVTHRVTPQSRGGERSSTLLSSLKGRLQNRGKAASQSRTGSTPDLTPEGGASTECHHRDPANETTETPTTLCDNMRPALLGHPGASKLSELHLYLPSSLCDDEEQDAETEEVRTSAETSAHELNYANPLVFSILHSQDQPNAGPGTPQHTI